MDLIEIAIRNARVDAVAKAKRLQTKGVGRDTTRKQRAKEANVRDMLVPTLWQARKHTVRFGPFVKPVAPLKLPLRGILKPRH